MPNRKHSCVLVLALTSLAVASSATAQGEAWLFNAQSATPLSLPDWLDGEALRLELGYSDPSTTEISGFRADLNADATEDYVLRTSLDVCGTNCEYLLVDGGTHDVLGRVGGSVIVVGPATINGYPVIRAYGHSSADSGRWSTSVFDGRSYVFVGSVELEGTSLTRLFETIGDLPYWPAR